MPRSWLYSTASSAGDRQWTLAIPCCFKTGALTSTLVIISRPEDDPEHVVIVNLTSHGGQENDCSCVLQPGDHSWVRHKTIVRYRDARIAKDAELDKLVASGALKQHDHAPDALLTKILQGAERTLHLPMKCRHILESQGLIER